LNGPADRNLYEEVAIATPAVVEEVLRLLGSLYIVDSLLGTIGVNDVEDCGELTLLAMRKF